jgi:hypothetical protein
VTAPDLSAGQPTSTQPEPAVPTQLTKTQKGLIGAVAGGSAAIAGIGFAGSYRAVTKLAIDKDFGSFAYAFPIGIDAGIGVLLALDLVLTGLRMPFPLLRQTAWFLTAATVAFNASSAWGDWLAVGMHATIPTLFIVVMEAARHAVGRIADITADRHIETPPIKRWILSPISTYRIWRRQHLWHLTSYTDVVAIEWEARIFREKLRRRYGRSWRRTAPAHEVMAIRLARLGAPIRQTLADHPAELAADGDSNPVAPGASTTAPAANSTASDSANSTANWRQNETTTSDSDTPELATAGDSTDTASGDNSTANWRQDSAAPAASNGATWRHQQDAPGASDSSTTGAKKPRPAATRRRTVRAETTTQKNTRRPMDEWVDLAGPVFHDEFQRLRRQPTGEEFAKAIETAGLGSVSASTAKNIRTAILDKTPMPAMD